jgi:serine/threonine-protein kinase RsbW
VVGFAQTVGASGRALDNIALAVSEAAANAAVHAFLGMPGPGSIVVTAESTGALMRVVLTDDGTGLSPRSNSPGLGLGLTIIAQLTETLEIVSGGEGGTELRMEFALAA